MIVENLNTQLQSEKGSEIIDKMVENQITQPGKTVKEIKSNLKVLEPVTPPKQLSLDFLLSETVSVEKTFNGALFNFAKKDFEKIKVSVVSGEEQVYCTIKGKITKDDIHKLSMIFELLKA
jgi:hypothetical protein